MKNYLTLVLAVASTTFGFAIVDDTQMPMVETPADIKAIEQQQPLVEWRGKNAVIWVSHISPVFLGQDAEGYDYEMLDCDDKPIESAYTLNDTFYSDASNFELMVALLNTTMGGTMSKEQSQDIHYLCTELEQEPAKYVPECKDIEWDDSVEWAVESEWEEPSEWNEDVECNEKCEWFRNVSNWDGDEDDER